MRSDVTMDADDPTLVLSARCGDPRTLSLLVDRHMPFVRKIACKYQAYGVPMNDLIQEGAVGFLHALRKYDPSRDVKLSTYAVWWIRAAIQDHVVRSWSIVRFGVGGPQKSLFFRLLRGERPAEGDGAGTPLSERLFQTLADRFNMSVSEVRIFAARLRKGDVSLDRPLSEGAGDERDTRETLHDRVPARVPTPEDLVAEKLDLARWREMIDAAFTQLTAREAYVVRVRFLGDVKVPRDRIGVELGVSKDRVRQIELRALKKLRVALADRLPDHAWPDHAWPDMSTSALSWRELSWREMSWPELSWPQRR